jgi:HK97 family phage major capsid protein
MKLKELLEKRNEAAQGMVSLRDKIQEEGRAFTAEEKENFDKASADYDSLDEQVEAIKRADDVQAKMDKMPGRDEVKEKEEKAGISEDDKRLAFNGWVRSHLQGEIREEEQDAIAKCKLNPNVKQIDSRMLATAPKTLAEARALSVGTPGSGGYTVPEGFVYNLEIALLKYGTMRKVAELMRTASGNAMPWPTVNDTTNEGVLVAEAGAIASDADPTFSEVVFNAYKYTSKFIKVSSELLEDSAFDMAAFLGRAIGERLGRAQNTACTTGDGSSKPNGIVTAATSQDTAGSGAFIADDLIDLVYSLDEAYDENAALMMNKAILKVVRKFKDSQGQYIWQPSYQAGEPETILGYAVHKNTKMASTVASGNKVAIFGDLSKYKIREVNSIRLKRLVELYAENDQEGFGGFLRFDGDLLDAGTNPVLALNVKA